MTTPTPIAANSAPAAAAAADPKSAADTLLGDPAAAKPGETPTDGTKPAEGEKPKEGEEPKEGDKAKDGDKPAGAPEKYEFVAPEGVELDPELMPELETLAREMNLPNDKAQKLVDLGAKIVQKQLAAIVAIGEQWAESARTDKEFGGEKLQENLAIGKRALDTYGTPGLKSLLNDTKAGNNPEMIRFMIRVGKTIKEDGVTPETPQGNVGKSAADIIFG